MVPYDLSAPWPVLDVVIEVPKWGFQKRGSNGHLDFLSPLPCPYNYGSVPGLLGLEGDLLDAVVLGPRLPRGSRVRVRAWGAVGLADRGLYDDKIICSEHEPNARQVARILLFFRVYGMAKRLLNWLRLRFGRTASTGWCELHRALARARPVPPGKRSVPVVRF